ncbi:LLM class flavin-dependent oxidoreductase [bacterium]|nr:LLM class flavin-dependent oxidoreductase [bacterium]
MDVRSEIKSIIAKKASTLKKVCAAIEQKNNEKISPNNLTNKFRRKTIKFDEVQEILEVLGYHIEFIEND